jgi:hypothetical protein
MVQILHHKQDNAGVTPVEIQKNLFHPKGNIVSASIFGEKLHMSVFVHNA